MKLVDLFEYVKDVKEMEDRFDASISPRGRKWTGVILISTSLSLLLSDFLLLVLDIEKVLKTIASVSLVNIVGFFGDIYMYVTLIAFGITLLLKDLRVLVIMLLIYMCIIFPLMFFGIYSKQAIAIVDFMDATDLIKDTMFLFLIIPLIGIYAFIEIITEKFCSAVKDSKDRLTIVIALTGLIISLITAFK